MLSPRTVVDASLLFVFSGQVGLDRDEMEVTVKAGTTLNQLNRYLNARGLAMKNLGSISEQTVAGAISTGLNNINSGTPLIQTPMRQKLYGHNPCIPIY